MAKIVRTPSHLGNCSVAIAFWLWQPLLSSGLGPESATYAMIDGHEIGPKFLAHITENRKRVIGFMVESLQAYMASISNLDKCVAVLSKLQRLGIAHGNLTRDSFLVVDSRGRAYLHGFQISYTTRDQGVLEKELASVENILKQSEETLRAPFREKLRTLSIVLEGRAIKFFVHGTTWTDC
ncbi:hypothetical protein M434DRAFT_28663 [Hypoxylon sp. CO27-5]|nr:hypothetical protein M434DRAFT_28663 [Hypoxylon sp. CO27-5]